MYYKNYIELHIIIFMFILLRFYLTSAFWYWGNKKYYNRFEIIITIEKTFSKTKISEKSFFTQFLRVFRSLIEKRIPRKS